MDKYTMTINDKKTMAFAGLIITAFITMLLICGAGVYGYAIAGQFDNVMQVGMIFTLESVARCAMIPLAGKLGDKVGRKKLFLSALVLYIVSYAVGAFSTNFRTFVIARMISGFSWGLFITNIFVLVADIFGKDEGPKFAGYLQSFSTAALIVGAPFAGIVCSVSWRLEFYITLPVLAAAFILCAIGLPSVPKFSEAKPMDTGGALCTLIFVVPFSLAMSWGGAYGWSSTIIIALFGAAGAGITGLILFERKAKEPIFPVRLLKNKFYVSIFIINFFYSVANASANYVPTFVQHSLNFNSSIAGIIALPGFLIAIVLTILFGRHAANTGRYKGMTMVWAFATIAAGIVFLFLGAAATEAHVIALLILVAGVTPLVAVNGAQQIVPYTYPMNVLKSEELAAGMAFMSFGGTFGNTFANGICGALMAAPDGILRIFMAPVFAGSIMVLCALLFKDIKQGETI
ncbi:MAG: MFS transporter [Spirochaetaceae bacterium]|jgi:MFS family permease|nr:MFS transporter [Spirochaetaceae bacterium]